MMVRKSDDKIFTFELAKITGLFIWFLISALSWAFTPTKVLDTKTVVLGSFMEAGAGYMVISLLFLILSRDWMKPSGKVFVLKLIIINLLLANIWTLTANTLEYYLLIKQPVFIHFVRDLVFFLYPVIAFTVVYYLINHKINLEKQKEMTLLATNLANDAQLKMLRYQINPHFLFNSLNTIRAMIEEDKTVARKMITELSNFFRYSLSHDGTTDNLGNEIEAIKNYLEIQKIRFEEKLVVEFDTDETLSNLKIPFFIILPLVENAVKYGLQTSPIPLSLKICTRAGADLEISVHNTGSLVKQDVKPEGTNTGLDNTRKRLELYYPGNHSFRLFEDKDRVVAEIIIKNYRQQLSI